MLFFVIALAVIALVYGYSGWRLLAPANLSLPLILAAWAVIVLLAVLPLVHLLYIRSSAAPGWLRHATAWVAYLGVGLAVVTFSLVLVRDLAWLAWQGLDGLGRLLHTPAAASVSQTDALASPARRQFLLNASGAGVMALSAVLCGYGLFRARQRPGIAHVRIPVADLPRAFEGLRIVQITDLHVGATIHRPFVEAVVDAVNGLDADIVALTGDLADGTVSELAHHVEPLGRLRARLGRYFVTGNHEYYSELEPWLGQARALGFDLLLNEHRVLQRGAHQLVIGGVTDDGGGHYRPDHAPDPVAALAGAPTGPRVVLAHQPRQAPAAVRAGADLVLSGHTHGGQFIPWKYVVSLQQPWIEGLHRVHGSSWVYVSRGTGYWGPPLRLGAPSEITCLTLTRA